MDFNFKLKKIIEDKQLIDAGDSLVIAVSGGVDSMTLLNSMISIRDDIGFLPIAVHINHKLREGDSDQDELFVKSFCEKNEVPFHSRDWTGPKSGENLQEAARKFRYDVLREIAYETGATKIAVAHNLNDQVETVLLNLFRGSSLDGLCGMDIQTTLSEDLFLIRPFLNFTRDEIEKEASRREIGFRSDSTNKEVKYNRNFIRHRVMPLVEKINSSALETISGMTNLLKRDELYLHDMAMSTYREIAKSSNGKIKIDQVQFEQYDIAIRTRVLKIAYRDLNGSQAGISRDHLGRMDQIATSSKPEGSYNLPNSIHFERKGRVLAIFKN